MPESLERRWAKLVKSYARLKELHEKSIQHRSVLVDELRDARSEAAELRREAKENDRASRKTMERLFASTQYAITHLYQAGDLVAAEKLDEWLVLMRESMQPVANVPQLIELLQQWCAAMPCDDPTTVSSLYMRTLSTIGDLNGTGADG